jgi:hypothetical protein
VNTSPYLPLKSEYEVTSVGIFGWPLTVGPTKAKPAVIVPWTICDVSFSFNTMPGDNNISFAILLGCF